MPVLKQHLAILKFNKDDTAIKLPFTSAPDQNRITDVWFITKDVNNDITNTGLNYKVDAGVIKDINGTTLSDHPTITTGINFTGYVILSSEDRSTVRSFGNGSDAWVGSNRLIDILAFNMANAPTFSSVSELDTLFDNMGSYNSQYFKTVQYDDGFLQYATNLSGAFNGATSFIGTRVQNWGVAQVTNMSYMFKGAITFNQPLTWNTSNVRNMSYMFDGATAFNGSTNTLNGYWNVSNVTDMSYMFRNATSFTCLEGIGLFSWVTSSVTNMSNMFQGAISFNPNNNTEIRNWNTTNVRNMSYMFDGASLFNGEIRAYGAAWNVSNVTDMSYMFRNATNFTGSINGGLSDWNTTNVRNMSYMFDGASAFNGIINTGGGAWNVSKVTDMSYMFRGASNFNRPLALWDVAGVRNMSSMFQGASSFTGEGLLSWNTSNVTNMSFMFRDANALYSGNPKVFKLPLQWPFNSGLTTDSMFSYTDTNSQLVEASITPDSSFYTAGLPVLSLQLFFDPSCTVVLPITGNNLTYLWNLSDFTDASSVNVPVKSVFIYGSITRFGNGDTPWGGSDYLANITASEYFYKTIKNLSGAFHGANSTKSQQYQFTGFGLNSWDVSGVTDMSYMFKGVTYLSQDLSGWNTSNVRNMSSMFQNATNFNSDLSGWTVSSVTNVTSMFRDASGCYTNGNFKFDLRNWDISNVGTTNRANFFSLNGLDTTTTDIKSPFYTPPLALTLTFDPSSNVSLPIQGSNLYYSLVDDIYINYVLGSDISCTTVKIYGDITDFGNSGNSWIGVGNLIDISATPHFFSTIKTLAGAFHGAGKFNTNVSYWDVSGVTDMSYMFAGAAVFNQDLSGWNVSNVTNMQGMFCDASAFNRPLASWNTSNIRFMTGMFDGTTLFNQPLARWDVSGVTSMTSMFRNALAFNQDLSGWNVSNVTDMSYMFQDTSGCYEFDGLEMRFKYDLHAWNTENVISKTSFFQFLNSDLTELDINSPFYTDPSVVGTTDLTFIEGRTDTVVELPIRDIRAPGIYITWSSTYKKFYKPGDTNIKSNNTDNTIFIKGGFGKFGNGVSNWRGAENLEKWVGIRPTGLTSLSGAFNGASNFDSPGIFSIKYWDVSGVTDMSYMFRNAALFNQDLSGWNVSKVTNMQGMFMGATAFNRPLASWNVSNVTNMQAMFTAATAFNQPLALWDVSGVRNMSNMFTDTGFFNQPLESWNTSNVTDMSYMYKGATVFNQDLSGWNVSKVTDMSHMFNGAYNFNRPLALWDVSGVRNMANMYEVAASFNQPLATWNTSNVVTMASMFQGAAAFNQDLSGWNTSKVTNMQGMFTSATAFNQPLANWNVSKVTNMQAMFNDATAFNQPLASWDVSGVMNMASMFRDASVFNQDLSGWNTSNVTDMSSMFRNAPECYVNNNYRYNLTLWNVEKVRSATNFFRLINNETTTTDPNSPFKIELVLSSSFRIDSLIKMDTKTYGIYVLDASSVLFDVSNQEIITYLEGKSLSNLKRMGSVLYGAISVDTSGKVFGFNTATNSLQYYDLSGSPLSTVLMDGNTLYISDTSKNIWALSSASQTMTLFKTLEENANKLRYEQNALYFINSSNLNIVQLTTRSIGKLDISSRIATTLDISAYTNPQSFVVDSSGTFYFFDNVAVPIPDSVTTDEYVLSSYSSSGYSQLWNFSTDLSIGGTPVGSLILDYSLTKEPILYGMCQTAGRYNNGTVWQYYKGIMTVLYHCIDEPISIDKINEYNLIYVVMKPNATAFNVRPYGRVGVRGVPEPTSGDEIITPNSVSSCFNRGTKILCKGEWKQIETLRCGDLVQTYKHGYRPITNIGKGSFINEPSIWHTCMYQGQKEGHEPLIITGGHSLLVDYLSLEEQEAQSVFWGRGEEVIDDKLLMIAPVSPEFKQITDNKVYTYYHFTVQNDGDNDRRYGVWANGFLTETPSENQYKQHKYHNL